MTKIIIKYANGNQEYFITESEDDIYILQLIKEIALTFKNVIGYEVKKEQKVKKR